MTKKYSLLPLVVCILLVAFAAVAKPKKGKKGKPPPAESAEPAATAPAAPAPQQDPEEAKKQESRTHFDRAITLFEEEAWDAALVEFQRSRELYPTRAATKNAAICLRKLHRFDEALEMFDTLLREFPDLPKEDKQLVERELRELSGMVGTVDIRMAEPGAAIVIDGRNRGQSPVSGPLRVAVGSHLVRVFKQGFAAFEARVDVASGQNVPVDVSLSPLTESGTLRVTEAGGKSVDVLIDNVKVGKTPWEGQLPVGEHTVTLKGEGTLGTQPTAATLRLGRATALALHVEALVGELRIEPEPVAATVTLDGVRLGRGLWEGRLRRGDHEVEVALDGFLTAKRKVTLERGKREALKVVLERDPNSPLWKRSEATGWFLDLGVGAPLPITNLKSELEDSCGAGCSHSPPVTGSGVLRVGYAASPVVGLSLDLGYLAVREKMSGRDTTVTPVGRPVNHGTASDTMWLRGPTLGASVALRTKTRFPVTFRLGGGVLFGTLKDTRRGQFTTNPSSSGQRVGYDTGTLEESDSARYAYAAPELRIGGKIGSHSEIGVGVRAFLLFALSQPHWKDQTPVVTGNCGTNPVSTCVTDGEAQYGDQALSGSFVLLVAPEIGFRQDF